MTNNEELIELMKVEIGSLRKEISNRIDGLEKKIGVDIENLKDQIDSMKAILKRRNFNKNEIQYIPVKVSNKGEYVGSVAPTTGAGLEFRPPIISYLD